MATKVGRNDRCPCRSGKKVKKCCGVPSTRRNYTLHDREMLFSMIGAIIDRELDDEEDVAYEEFWGEFLDREDELGPDFLTASNDLQFMWFACDYMLSDGETLLERLLAAPSELSVGMREFAEQLKQAPLKLYQVSEVVPGASISLRDAVGAGDVVTVAERTASRTIHPFDWIAARVIASGPSGGPEMERGLVGIPPRLAGPLCTQLKAMQQDALHSGRWAELRETVPMLMHEAWVSAILKPQLPVLHNTDDEPILITREHFDVLDRVSLEKALDGHAELERDGSRWAWSRANRQGELVSLGVFELNEGKLVLECNSKERGARGRAWVTELAAGSVRHRLTTHEDIDASILEGVRAKAAGQAPRRGSAPAAIPPDVAKAVVLEHYDKHYRAWIDEPVPALGGATPRAAAAQPELRARVVELLEGSRVHYQRALSRGEPAYDPSWMWSELGLQPD